MWTKGIFFFASVGQNSPLCSLFVVNNDCSDEEWSDDEKGEGGKEGAKDDLEELDEMQLGELLAREQRARHMGLSQVRSYFRAPQHTRNAVLCTGPVCVYVSGLGSPNCRCRIGIPVPTSYIQ